MHWPVTAMRPPRPEPSALVQFSYAKCGTHAVRLQCSASHQTPLPAFRPDVDPDADPLTRVIGHLGDVPLAMVVVVHAVSVDPLLTVFAVTRFTALNRVCNTLDVVAVAFAG
mgnify:CR=1 FL=1